METIKVKHSGMIELAQIGNLYIGEAKKNVLGEIKRFYFIRDLAASDVRGNHAHKKLEQYIFCVNGSFTLGLDDGETKQEILMNKPGIGIKLGAKLWHTMSRFSKDCVIFVAANDYYDESDYIRDYKEFLKYL